MTIASKALASRCTAELVGLADLPLRRPSLQIAGTLTHAVSLQCNECLDQNIVTRWKILILQWLSGIFRETILEMGVTIANAQDHENKERVI